MTKALHKNALDVERQFGCFHVLVTVNNVAVNIGVHVPLQINVFKFSRYMPRRGIPGSYSNSILNFLRNLHTVFHSGCTSLESHQEYAGFPFLRILTSTCYC